MMGRCRALSDKAPLAEWGKEMVGRRMEKQVLRKAQKRWPAVPSSPWAASDDGLMCIGLRASPDVSSDKASKCPGYIPITKPSCQLYGSVSLLTEW